jgi:hypothetical protein
MAGGVVDWSGLSRLGTGLAAGLEDERKQTLAQLMGAQVQAGDYKGAAAAAFKAGDLSTGLGLIKLGDAREDKVGFQKMLADGGGMAAALGGGPIDAGTGTPATVSPRGPAFSGTSGPASSYLDTLRGKESGGSATAQNPNSSATGIDQFTAGTWEGLRKKYPELGLTPDGRTDVAQSTRAMERFTRDNAGVLSGAGVPITPGNLYVAHFLGAGGAARFIRGAINNPEAPAASFVDPKSVSANRTIFYNRDGSPKTAGQVYAERTSRFGGSGATAAAPEAAPARVQVASADASFMPQMPSAAAGVSASPAGPTMTLPGAEPGPQGPTMTLPQDPVASEQRVQVAQAVPQVFSQAGLNPRAAAQLQATQPGSAARIQTIVKFMSHPGAPEGFKEAMKAALANEYAIDKENRSMTADQKAYNWDVAVGGFKGTPMEWRAAKASAERAPAADPVDIQKYEYSKRQGYTGSLVDFLRTEAEARSTKINNNVNLGAENEQDKVAQKDLGDTQVTIRKGASAANASIPNIQLMQKLVDDPSFYSGSFGNLSTEAKKALASVGLGAADGARANEGFKKLSSQFILDKAGGSLGGGFSNGDRQFIQETGPNIENTPAGNKLILEMSMRVAQRAQQVHQMMVDYKADPANKGRIDDKFLASLDRFAALNPVFAGLENMPGVAPGRPREPGAPAPGQRDASVQAPKMPSVGEKRGGYTFTGGNPADRASWRKD